MPCEVFRAHCAPGGPEQNQRRQRLAHPERPLCPISVQRQADWEIAFSAAQHSDAAGTRLARPRTAIFAEGGRTTRPVLSKKDRTAVVSFLVSQATAAATWAEGFAVSYPRNDRTASTSAGAGVISRWCYMMLYCNGLCGKDVPGGVGCGGRATGREHCMGSPASNGADV